MGYVARVGMEYGKKHRLIFGPQVIIQDLAGNSLEVKAEVFPCYSLIVGYRGIARFGLMWQIYIGDIYMQDPKVDSNKYSHYSHVGIGLGYLF